MGTLNYYRKNFKDPFDTALITVFRDWFALHTDENVDEIDLLTYKMKVLDRLDPYGHSSNRNISVDDAWINREQQLMLLHNLDIYKIISKDRIDAGS